MDGTPKEPKNNESQTESQTEIGDSRAAAPHREFLGLGRPPLLVASDWLAHRFRTSDRLDFREVVVVVPTARTRTRLLQLLVDIADEWGLELIPPHITTVGDFPELLYSAKRELATDLAQQIAWAKALQESPRDDLQKLTGRVDVDEFHDWQPMAKVLSRLHRRLANDVWSFRSVAREVKNLSGFLQDELERWDVLERIQQRYYAQLGSVDLWDRQAARNVAIHRGLCRIDKQVVLVGVADLNHSVRRMLEQIASQVIALVAADESMSELFDEFGNLSTEAWYSRQVEIDERRIRIVDRPEDQALAVAHYLSELPSGFSTDQITVGLPDEEVLNYLQKNLSELELPHRNLAGVTLDHTTPVQLMIACRNYLEEEDYDSFATLVRHPDMFAWLAGHVDDPMWLGGLADYQIEKLPSRLSVLSQKVFGDPEQIRMQFEPGDRSSQRRAERKAESVTRLNQVHACVAELLAPLAGESKPIADWTQPWNQILVRVYSEREIDPASHIDRGIVLACDSIYSALGDHRQIPESWHTNVKSTTALEMAIEAASDRRVAEPARDSAIEIAGWLDLPMDDAPVMIVTGMNDEHVPASEVGHQFLPNKLCEQLGIEDNRRRYARDVYALTLIHEVREDLLLIMARQNDRSDPVKPSRLFFATDALTAAKRANAFFTFDGELEEYESGLDVYPTLQQLEVPKPIGPNQLTSLTVTSFKEYIKCPYRFYLGKVLRLQGVQDDWRELNAGLFGDLTHEVLEAFGRHEIRKSEDANEIDAFLSDQLNTIARERYEGSRLPSVRIQIEQLRMRLSQFAIRQAEYRRGGWLIVSVEEMLYHNLMVDGEPFEIRGKIDRVDKNEQTGEVAIWDYKTSDRGDSPGYAHYTSYAGWKDLQLPLYRYLVKEVKAVEKCNLSNVGLGYVLLPKQVEKIGFESTDWDPELLKTADEAAFDVIRKIRDCQFWPPAPKPPMYSFDYAAICQDNVFEKFDTTEPEETLPVVEAPF